MTTNDRQHLVIHPDWIGQGLTGDELLVLARLDSYWRNAHRAHPSDSYIAQQTGFHVRKIQRLIATLEEKGWLERRTVSQRKSRGGKERLLLPTSKVRGPEVDDKSAGVDDTIVGYVDDKSVGKVDDKSVQGEIERENRRGRVGHANGVARPDSISAEVWSDFLAHRRAKKAKLTQTAWKPMERELQALVAEGWNPDDVLAEVMAAGWQSFKAEWIRNRTQPQKRQDDSPFAGAL